MCTRRTIPYNLPLPKLLILLSVFGAVIGVLHLTNYN